MSGVDVAARLATLPWQVFVGIGLLWTGGGVASWGMYREPGRFSEVPVAIALGAAGAAVLFYYFPKA